MARDPLFPFQFRLPIHKPHPRQDEFPVERAGGELDEQFAGGGEEDFGGVLLDEAGDLDF